MAREDESTLEREARRRITEKMDEDREISEAMTERGLSMARASLYVKTRRSE